MRDDCQAVCRLFTENPFLEMASRDRRWREQVTNGTKIRSENNSRRGQLGLEVEIVTLNVVNAKRKIISYATDVEMRFRIQ